jgi:hypothetical protein
MMLDSYNIFDRTNNKKPFLLADGHGSRLRFPLVQYAKKSKTPWSVSFGVPYATHIWQVHDSNKLNGAFKSKMKDKKSEIIEKRGEYKFKTSDVVPLVKQCFNQTFGNKQNAKKAIIERGWGPLNYACLDHVELQQNNEEETTTANNNTNTIPLRPELDFDCDVVHRPLWVKYIDVLYNEVSKSKAKKKKLEERKKQIDDDEKGYTKIKNLIKLTSGQMAANNHYNVTDDEVYEYIIRQQQENKKKKTAISKKQAGIEKK